MVIVIIVIRSCQAIKCAVCIHVPFDVMSFKMLQILYYIHQKKLTQQ